MPCLSGKIQQRVNTILYKICAMQQAHAYHFLCSHTLLARHVLSKRRCQILL